jgi:hypothetical protein
VVNRRGVRPRTNRNFNSDRSSATRPLAEPTLTRSLSRRRNATTSAPVNAPTSTHSPTECSSRLGSD